MTVIVQVPSKQYTPHTFSTAFSVPAGTKTVQATMTRESWPAGPVGGLTVNFPDGTLAAGVTFDGGTQLNRDGSVQTLSGVNFSGPGGADLPAGSYAVVVQVLQTLTTAITAERF